MESEADKIGKSLIRRYNAKNKQEAARGGQAAGQNDESLLGCTDSVSHHLACGNPLPQNHEDNFRDTRSPVVIRG